MLLRKFREELLSFESENAYDLIKFASSGLLPQPKIKTASINSPSMSTLVNFILCPPYYCVKKIFQPYFFGVAVSCSVFYYSGARDCSILYGSIVFGFNRDLKM